MHNDCIITFCELVGSHMNLFSETHYFFVETIKIKYNFFTPIRFFFFVFVFKSSKIDYVKVARVLCSASLLLTASHPILGKRIKLPCAQKSQQQ